MKKTNDPKELAAVMRRMGKGHIRSDVTGSYTGTYDDPEDMQPVQDADDL